MASRIRSRLVTEKAPAYDLQAAPNICSRAPAPPLRHTCANTHRTTTACSNTLANELLTTATQRELSELDEKLYFEVFAPSTPSSRRRRVKHLEPDYLSCKTSHHKPTPSQRLLLPEPSDEAAS